MPYYLVESFRDGIDLRRSPVATAASALYDCVNAHITPGGDIEKRKAFIAQAPDVSGTKGLAAINQSLFVFGTSATPPTGITLYEPGVTELADDVIYYMQLDLGGAALADIADVELFNGKLYVVAKGDDDNYYYFLDGAVVATGQDVDQGIWSRTFKTKMYSVRDGILSFSALDRPEYWDLLLEDGQTESGAGFIELNNQDSGATRLSAIEIYYNWLAIFSENSVQFWSVASDPRENQQEQVLRSTGTLAHRSPRQYADGDVLYLATSGIRSLRARNSSNAASVSDVGSPIDKLIQSDFITLTDEQFRAAFSLVHPLTGRFWMLVNDKIYVLSYFPAPDVTAWSIYDPGFTPTDGVAFGQRLALRSEDTIYLYGGDTGNEFDSCPVEIVTPYLSADKPATFKQFQGLDLLCEGLWNVDYNINPTQRGVWSPCGAFTEASYHLARVGFQALSTHVAFRLRHEDAGEAILSQLVFHYAEAYAS